MSNPVVKTYFMTDQCENQYPIDFVCSTNPRYIEVHPCYIEKDSTANILPDKLIAGIMMHGDFVERNAYQDHALLMCNERRSKYKKYQIRGCRDSFRLFFTDHDPSVTYEYTFERINSSNEYYPYVANNLFQPVPPTDIYRYLNVLKQVIQGHDEEMKIKADAVYNVASGFQPKSDPDCPLSRYNDEESSKYTGENLADHFLRKYDPNNMLPDIIVSEKDVATETTNETIK